MDEIDIKIDNIKYCIIGMIGCICILIAIFGLSVQRQHRIDKIFEKYDREMAEINKDYQLHN